MTRISAVHTIIVPFLFVVTVPLAIFASITTLLAFSILFCRVVLVYLDLLVSLIPQAIHRRCQPRILESPPSSVLAGSSASSPTLHRRRHRRNSVISTNGSASSLISERSLGLMPSVGPERDFEGIGGWRVGEADNDAWTTVNPRIESPGWQHGRLHHHRSHSGGPVTPGDSGILMMKSRARSPASVSKLALPNSGRARTPPTSRAAITSDSYFPSSASNPGKGARKLSVSALVE